MTKLKIDSVDIILEPTVTVLSAPTFTPHPRYELPDDEVSDSAKLVAMAGKGCYDAYGKDGRNIPAHIDNLIASGHGSVLEHANVSLFIEGISRGCSHEIVRHRAGFAYSQRSTRYTDESDCAFIADPYFADLVERWFSSTTATVSFEERELAVQFVKTCKESLARYKYLVHCLERQCPSDLKGTSRRKWARGKARGALNHFVETRMTMTGNLRAWRNFIEQRSASGAEAEIRRLSNVIYNTLAGIAPEAFSDYTAELVDGYFVFIPGTKKV